MNTRALLISCSKSKVATSGLLPAIELYDGPYYRMIRKLKRDGLFPSTLDIFIISAKHGLITSGKLIEPYEFKMDLRRAKELRPSLTGCIKAHLKHGQYGELFVNLGAVYLEAVRGYDRQLPPDMHIIQIGGEIGRRISAMKKWILSL